jgi:hypothetical protein
MDEQLKKLIQFYAQYPVAKIEGDPELTKAKFGKSRLKLHADSDFTSYESTVKRQKQRIERCKALNNPDPRSRVSESLELLWHISRKDDLKRKEGERSVILNYEVLKQLLWEMFSGNWSPAQQEHFTYYATRIPGWYNCFISYTNQKAKQINRWFWDVIDNNLLSEDINKRDRETDNMLPDVIAHLFDEENLRPVFFDKHAIRPGQLLSAEIETACAGSFVFLQLVDKGTFHEITPNWPFEEYQTFEQNSRQLIAIFGPGNNYLNQRLSAIVAANDTASVYPIILPPDYQAWADVLLSARRHEILPTDPKQFSDRLKSVMTQIRSVILGMLKNVPP